MTFEEEDLKAYVLATSVILKTPQHSPGVLYLIYVNETGDEERIALDDHRTNEITLLYDVDETVRRLKLYGLEPVEGVSYREYSEAEKPWEIDIDFGNAKYMERLKRIQEKRTENVDLN